jgi:hypothetical protein
LADTALIGVVLSFFELLLVHLLIETVHLPHLFDFIKIHNEATLISMVLFDALSAKDSKMIRAIEMLDPLIMLFAKQTLYAIFVFKVDISQNVVSFHNLIQDVKIERQLVYALHLLHQFPADGAPHSEVVMESRKALSAKSMAAMDQNSWNLLSNIKLFTAIVTKIKSPSFIVSLEQILGPVLILLVFNLLSFGFSFSAKSVVLLATLIEWFTLESIRSILCHFLHFLNQSIQIQII